MSDFYPTPSTVSTVIYYTGVDPRTMRKVYCPTNPHEKAMQRALIQYRNPKNYDLVVEALRRAHREDLIGYGPKCLVRPTRPKATGGGEHGRGRGKGAGKGRGNGHGKGGRHQPSGRPAGKGPRGKGGKRG